MNFNEWDGIFFISQHLYVHVVRFGKEDNRCLHDRNLQVSVDCQDAEGTEGT